jgi:hypothetical protein
MANKEKIFNIGFHKTGTTSLTHFMGDNSYKTLHNTAYTMQRLNLGSQFDIDEKSTGPVNIENTLNKTLLQELVQEYDFFSDNPWPLLYKLLDQEFPKSKFILTRRNTDSWINSLVKYSGSQHTRMRQLIYGYGNPENHITHYRKTYIRHNKDVVRYFCNRKDLLVIDIEDDDSTITKSLAEFLGLGDSLITFPTSNKA